MGMKILIEMFFSLKKDSLKSRTRRHEVTLAKDQCGLDIRKYLFSIICFIHLLFSMSLLFSMRTINE